MNDMNSIILEGKVQSVTKAEDFVSFVVNSSRKALAENGEQVEVVTEVPCRVVGDLMKSVSRNAEPGRGVRVVGRIDGFPIYILVEHIEYRMKK